MQNEQGAYSKLLVSLAYIAVILIWSTTPLTIKWSSEGVGFLFGISLRMIIGALVASILVILLYGRIPLNKQSIMAYVAVSLALFAGMIPVYWASQYISSGLISVIFGLSPILTGYLGWRFIQEQGFSPLKILGSLAGIAGLLVIFLDDLTELQYVSGIIATLTAVCLHAASAIWVKSLKTTVPALTMVAGGLILSLPLYGLLYLFLQPELPEDIPLRAIWSIVYLGVVGSVFGFVCYYYLLKRLNTSTVALITLITPVMALYIGNIFNQEAVGAPIITGTLLVLIGLALHQWGDLLSNKVWRKRKYYYG